MTMNTYINLGILLKISETTLQEIEHILDLIENYQTDIEITHPEEGDYNDWRTEAVTGENIYSMIDKLAYRGAYASISLRIKEQIFKIKLQTKNEDDQILVEIEIDQESLLESLSIQEADTLIRKVMETIAMSTDYEYMYSDHEAEYLYTKERLVELGFIPYSLLKFSGRAIVSAQWYPDGFTLRETH